MVKKLALATGFLAQAKVGNPVLGNLGNLDSPTAGLSFFQRFVPNLIGLGFAIGILVFVFVLITGALTWIGAGGDKTALESARTRVSFGLIGLVFLFALFAILTLLQAFLGVSILSLNLDSLVIPK